MKLLKLNILILSSIMLVFLLSSIINFLFFFRNILSHDQILIYYFSIGLLGAITVQLLISIGYFIHLILNKHTIKTSIIVVHFAFTLFLIALILFVINVIIPFSLILSL
jgi:hypothetical protein